MKDFNFQNVLITGGAGFIGNALIRKLLLETNANIYNLDKLSYSSDLKSIDKLLIKKSNKINRSRYNFFKCDLTKSTQIEDAILFCKPDLIMHLAAESHVDRSINSPLNLFKVILLVLLIYWSQLENILKI